MVGLVVDRDIDVKSSSFCLEVSPPLAGSKRAKSAGLQGSSFVGRPGSVILHCLLCSIGHRSNGPTQLKGGQGSGCVTRKKGL